MADRDEGFDESKIRAPLSGSERSALSESGRKGRSVPAGEGRSQRQGYDSRLKNAPEGDIEFAQGEPIRQDRSEDVNLPSDIDTGLTEADRLAQQEARQFLNNPNASGSDPLAGPKTI